MLYKKIKQYEEMQFIFFSIQDQRQQLNNNIFVLGKKWENVNGKKQVS